MRFLYYDRIVEIEAGKRAVAIKSVSLTEAFVEEHYRRRALVPPTILIECLAQLAGWLHTVSAGFALRTVLGSVEEVKVFETVGPGATLRLEVWSDFLHKDGATLHGEASVDGRPVLRVGRFLFASRPETDPAFIRKRKETFHYMSGGYDLVGSGNHD